jgi:hypothetical protein
VGNTVVRSVAQIAQGQVGGRRALAQVGGDDFIHHVRGDIAVEHPRSPGDLDVHQRLGEAQAQAAHPADLSRYPTLFKGRLESRQHAVATGGLAAKGGAYSDPGDVPGGKGLPALFSFSGNFWEAYIVLQRAGAGPDRIGRRAGRRD